MTTDDLAIPRHVASRLGPEERVLAVMPAAQGAGLAVTTDRLIRWRPPGAAQSVDFTAIRRVDLRNATREHKAALTFHCAGTAPVVTVPLDERHLPWIAETMTVLATAILEAGRTHRRPVRLQRDSTPEGHRWSFDPIGNLGLAGRLRTAAPIDPGWDDLRSLVR